MWALDRLSSSNNQAAPVPSNYPYSSRPYSPGPRRSSHLPPNVRPPLGGRASSQVSLSSTSSLPTLSAQNRFTNGSSLKHQLTSSPAAQVDDPLQVLDGLVGSADSELRNGDAKDATGKPLVISSDIDFEGLSLQDFVDRENAGLAQQTNRLQTSQQPAEEYEKERHKFEDLHKSITACDDVLKSVESYLSSFQADLSAVSTEIETLQTRSSVLNGQLDNRRKVEKLLGPTVDRIGLPSTLVKRISDGPVDDAWARALADLQIRAKAVEAEDLSHVHALDDLKPLVDNLCNKAAERIKEYFAAQIRSLRSPNVNAQLIQQQGFLKFKSLYLFLAVRQPQLAEEIMQAYSNTMRWYYYTSFSRYHASLTKMKIYTTDRFDAIGEDPSSQGRHRASTNHANAMPSQDVFSLGRRLDVVRSPTTAAIPSHAADESKQTHHIETPFQAFNLALIDNASFEYSFLTNFFSLNDPAQMQNGTETQQSPPSTLNNSVINRHFTAIFSPVLNLGSSLTKSLVAESFDALGILILVRLTQHLAFLLQRRCIPSLESYVNGTQMVLWPRYQVVLDSHCTSLKQLTASLSNRANASSASASTFATLSGGSNGNASTAPHQVTQRFANFAHALVSLSSEAADDEPVTNSFTRLRGEFEAFLKKAAGVFGSGDKARKEKKRFMFNNYSLVLTVLSDCRGKLADEVRQEFESLKQENV